MKGLLYILLAVVGLGAFADVPLIGSNIPNESLLDGDFGQVKAGWRQPGRSPYWTTQAEGAGYGKAGFALGKMMNTGVERATFESVVLDHTELKSLETGDVLEWRFASNTEYPCDGRVTLALVFGGEERVVADRVKVPNGPAKPKVYEGYYTVTPGDARRGMPRIKFTLETTHGIKVYVDWVDLKVLQGPPIRVAVSAIDEGIELTWNGNPQQTCGLRGADIRSASAGCGIYRSSEGRKAFEKVAEAVKGNRWIDGSNISGKTFYYAVKQGETVSPVLTGRKVDSIPPAAPQALEADGADWTVRLNWKTEDGDVEYHKVYRDGTCIAPHVTGTSFEDDLPVKGVENTYAVMAVDYSGNEGTLSETASARTRAVRGASFSDLILPMPIHKHLRSDVWGAENVVPRDPDNGVEDSIWSYWGGKVVGEGGKYHINVVRWPEGDRKGHWAWPQSTVAYAVSSRPDGPFRIVRDTAYGFQNGRGHNANTILLKDGRYAMYSLIDWKAMVLTADSIGGPWKVLGEIQVNVPENYKNAYRLERNLSGVQCEDGSFLFATKAGAVMRSTNGILGPYGVVSGVVQENETIPEKYRNSNYEDPAFWYDGVQYHMLINAFLDYRAIYLRSPDGVHWKYEAGLAYTPSCTRYEDGTRTFWYKVERPNVLQDEYGRATHLSLAAIDVPKRDDYGNDNHSSKHLVIPLVVNKRLTLLDNDPEGMRLLIHSEEGFDAANDLDLGSLRFGGSEAVNFGGGAEVVGSEPHPDGLVVAFKGNTGLSDRDFVGKMIGQMASGGLVVGYSKLAAK